MKGSGPPAAPLCVLSQMRRMDCGDQRSNMRERASMQAPIMPARSSVRQQWKGYYLAIKLSFQLAVDVYNDIKTLKEAKEIGESCLGAPLLKINKSQTYNKLATFLLFVSHESVRPCQLRIRLYRTHVSYQSLFNYKVFEVKEHQPCVIVLIVLGEKFKAVSFIKFNSRTERINCYKAAPESFDI